MSTTICVCACGLGSLLADWLFSGHTASYPQLRSHLTHWMLGTPDKANRDLWSPGLGGLLRQRIFAQEASSNTHTFTGLCASKVRGLCGRPEEQETLLNAVYSFSLKHPLCSLQPITWDLVTVYSSRFFTTFPILSSQTHSLNHALMHTQWLACYPHGLCRRLSFILRSWVAEALARKSPGWQGLSEFPTS